MEIFMSVVKMLKNLMCEAYNSALEIIETANLKEKDINNNIEADFYISEIKQNRRSV